jgi:hypothetical protein
VRIYSKGMVPRRLIPLVVAFAVAFAPVALEACQASCQSHAVETAASGSEQHHHSHPAAQTSAMPAGHVHHHSNGTQPAQSAAAVAAQPHPCDHGDGLSVFSPQLQNTAASADGVASAFRFPEPEARCVRARALDARAYFARITRTPQLRV